MANHDQTCLNPEIAPMRETAKMIDKNATKVNASVAAVALGRTMVPGKVVPDML